MYPVREYVQAVVERNVRRRWRRSFPNFHNEGQMMNLRMLAASAMCHMAVFREAKLEKTVEGRFAVG